MWPFKKKSLQQDPSREALQTVICIPGTWNSWDEFILSTVQSTNGKYLAVGNILYSVDRQRHYTIDFCERDEKMKEAFKYAGMASRVTDSFLDEIGTHKHVVYLSGTTGSLEAAGYIAFAAEAILNAGGLGVKIETSGKAFEKRKWFTMLENLGEARLYQMFVTDSIVDQDGTVYSCGMQNLGFKDTIVSGEEFQKAVSLISIFSFYQIIDKPTIKNGQTFSNDMESPKLIITDEPNQPYKGDELFENPYGMWRLTKA